MKLPIRGKNPPVLRLAPFGKGGQWGTFRRCFERGAAHFHLLCCAHRYMSYFALFAAKLADPMTYSRVTQVSNRRTRST